jgi:hypothetical protein
LTYRICEGDREKRRFRETNYDTKKRIRVPNLLAEKIYAYEGSCGEDVAYGIFVEKNSYSHRGYRRGANASFREQNKKQKLREFELDEDSFTKRVGKKDINRLSASLSVDSEDKKMKKFLVESFISQIA